MSREWWVGEWFSDTAVDFTQEPFICLRCVGAGEALKAFTIKPLQANLTQTDD